MPLLQGGGRHIGDKGFLRALVVLEKCGVASVEQELLEGNCVIVILVMLLHCTDLEDERRPSVVNSSSLDSTGEEQLLQTDESSGNHCCMVCKHTVIGKSSSSSDVIPTTDLSTLTVPT